MKVYYDREKTKEIEDKIVQRWGDNKKEWAVNGYNVSECANCEVKCYCRRTGVEERITKKSIGFLVFGIIAEFVIMDVYPPEQRQYEGNLNDLVFGHMDVYEDFMYPLEGKATAKHIFKAVQIPIYWINQLIDYITMSKGNKGWIIILDIFTRNISAFCVELTKEEKLMQIEVLMDKVSRYDKAIETKDPNILIINPEEYEMCNFKHSCSRRLECHEKHKQLKKEKQK